MSSFTSPLKCEVLDNGNIETLEPFEYYTILPNGEKEYIKVPAHFVSDFASIPQIFQMVISKTGNHSKPAVLHDFLCEEFHKGKITRKYADKIFLEAMGVKKVSKFKKYLIYFSVRFYAWIKGYK